MSTLPDAYAQEWVKYAESELQHQRLLLAQGETMNRAIIERDMAGLSRAVAEQDRLLNEGEILRRKREALRRTAASHLSVAVADMRVEALLPNLPERLQAAMDTIVAQLREVAQALSRMQERNQALLRSGLGVVRDCLAIIAGPAQGDGYTRKGHDADRQTIAGGLLDLSG